ncbi:cupredoxin domain-containing protein [Alphaproteobacteria bacterium]|nr:cupredoxin domain-containing protein [Alphaproteobacteria bacterium]
MKKLFLTTLATSFLIPLTAHAEESVQHYAAQSIQGKEEALKTFEKKNAEISKLLKFEKLQDSNLETIHEISYTLEAAIDKLIALKSAPEEKLGTIDEAVQALHHASEDHNEEQTREWFTKLETRISSLDNETKESPNTKKTRTIIIKNHKFTPEEVHIPAGEKIKLIVDNQDPTPEEFESDDLRREKIIAGNSKATIYIGPVKPGKYHFFGEFNLDTANGYIIAK